MSNKRGGNNHGYQAKNMFFYLLYIYSYLVTHKLKPNKRDLNFKQNYNQLAQILGIDYKRCINRLLAEKIIRQTSNSNYTINIARHFRIDRALYIDYLNSCVNKIGNQKTIDFLKDKIKLDGEEFELFLQSICLSFSDNLGDVVETISNYINSNEQLSYIDMMKEHAEYQITDYQLEEARKTLSKNFIDKINNIDFKLFEPFIFKSPSKLTNKQLTAIYSLYRNNLCSSTVVSLLRKEKYRAEDNNYQVRIPNKVSFKKRKNKKSYTYTIKTTCRQTNDLCILTSEERKEYLERSGYKFEFDVHCMNYTLARLFNFGIIDLDWDLKSLLLQEKYTYEYGGLVTRDDLKQITMRTFFKTSSEKAYTQYKYSINKENTKRINRLSCVSLATFKSICDKCNELAGEDSKYKNVIFFLESIIEMRIVNNLLEKGISVLNVYDCFYYKNENDLDTIKSVICETMIQSRYEFIELNIFN